MKNNLHDLAGNFLICEEQLAEAKAAANAARYALKKAAEPVVDHIEGNLAIPVQEIGMAVMVTATLDIEICRLFDSLPTNQEETGQ